jgi:hypothetical protein
MKLPVAGWIISGSKQSMKWKCKMADKAEQKNREIFRIFFCLSSITTCQQGIYKNRKLL